MGHPAWSGNGRGVGAPWQGRLYHYSPSAPTGRWAFSIGICSMSRKQFFSRLLGKVELKISGFIGTVAGIAIGLVFRDEVPAVIGAYLVFWAVTAGVCSFLVLKDFIKEQQREISQLKHVIEQLRLRLSEQEHAQPRIRVGFQDDRGALTETLQLILEPLPPEPDYNALVERKKTELLSKFHQYQQSASLLVNHDYASDLQEYLQEYRDVLARRYQLLVVRKRAQYVRPMALNEGRSPADTVTLEFQMPTTFRNPTERQYAGVWLDLALLQSDDPEPPLPWEPQVSFHGRLAWTLRNSVSLADFADPAAGHHSAPTTAGAPIYKKRNGTQLVAYEIAELVPGQVKDDLEPILLWLPDVVQSATWDIPVQIYARQFRGGQAGSKVRLEILLAEPMDDEVGKETGPGSRD